MLGQYYELSISADQVTVSSLRLSNIAASFVIDFSISQY